MKTVEQIARDMREGTFPEKSEATIREERGGRPEGSNADEWRLFLSDHLDTQSNYGLTYVAVQIVEAIEAAINAERERCALVASTRSHHSGLEIAEAIRPCSTSPLSLSDF